MLDASVGQSVCGPAAHIGFLSGERGGIQWPTVVPYMRCTMSLCAAWAGGPPPWAPPDLLSPARLVVPSRDVLCLLWILRTERLRKTVGQEACCCCFENAWRVSRGSIRLAAALAAMAVRQQWWRQQWRLAAVLDSCLLLHCWQGRGSWSPANCSHQKGCSR